MRRANRKGFTLVELVITLAISALVLGIVYKIFTSQRRGHVVQEQVGEAQQNARVAADELTRAIKSIGNNVARDPNVPANNQQQLHYCGPYEILFSSDLNPEGTALPAVNAGTAVYSYTPAVTFATGAETYRYSFDRDRDGDVDADDRTDTRHYGLYREVFSAGGSQVDEVARNLNVNDDAGTAAPLFRYWGDFDGDGSTDPWPDPLAPVTDLSGAGRGLDRMIRRVEIVVIAETRAADSEYAAYKAASGGYRQSVVQSNVTPRNLWSCPLILPQVTVATSDWASAAGDDVPYLFDVTYLGDPDVNRQVFFSLTGPPNTLGTAPTRVQLLTADTTTTAAGVATATIRWPDAAAFTNPAGPYYPYFIAGQSIPFTLTATVAAATTPLGTCDATSTSMQIVITPAPANRVVKVSPATAPVRPTCGGANATFVYQAVRDEGGSTIPAPLDTGASIDFTTEDGAPPAIALGTVNPTTVGALSPATAPPYSTQVVYTPPSPWPVGARRPGNFFQATIAATLTGSPFPPDRTGSVTLVPEPTQIVNYQPGANPISGPVYTDCDTRVAKDTFDLVDCWGNLVYQLTGLGLTPDNSYRLRSRLAPTTGLGTLADPVHVGNGRYEVVYTPPTCTIGPPAGTVRTAHYGIHLRRSVAGVSQGTPVHQWPTNFVSSTVWPTEAQIHATGLPINLQSCADCAVTFADNITPCTKVTTVQVLGCDILVGKAVTLTLTTTGGATGYFNTPATGTTFSTTFNAAFEATANLYVTSAPSGSKFIVTATIAPQANVTWSCVGEALVDTECLDLTIEHLNQQTKQWEPVDNVGGQSCLSKINELRFTVEDCQVANATLRDAVTVYLVSDDGLYLDYEKLDLDKVDPMLWRYSSLLVGLNETPSVNDGLLTYPSGRAVTLIAAYTDTSVAPAAEDYDPKYGAAPVPLPFVGELDCRKVVSLVTPVPVCFPNAITSGGGGGWNGNFNVHWGDVVIRGDVKLASKPKFLTKSETGQFDGNVFGGGGNSDRFFDIYVGHSNPANTLGGNFLDNSKTPIPNPNPTVLDRPFLPGRAGAGFGTAWGNYYRNVSFEKITEMMRELDYDTMKRLAKERNVYWYTLPGGDIRNPATNKVASLEDVLNLPGVNKTNQYYTGEFVFVDTFGTATTPPATTGADIDATPTAALPSFSVGSIYTEGIVYLVGTLDYKGGGGGFNVSARTPPEYDIPKPYVHNDLTWVPTEDDLPVRSDPAQVQRTFTIGGVNINGALYLEGEAAFSGSPRIYGAISAERGFTGSGTPEIWYNYDLNVSQQDNTLCVNCCSLEIDPAVVTLPECSGITLTGVNAAGKVVWVSENLATATVSALGNFEARASTLALGTARIKGVDTNNCPAWSTLAVVPLAVNPAAATVRVGSTVELTVDAPAGTNVTWTVLSGPVSVTPLADRRRATVLGLNPGNAEVEAKIGGCQGSTAIFRVIP